MGSVGLPMQPVTVIITRPLERSDLRDGLSQRNMDGFVVHADQGGLAFMQLTGERIKAMIELASDGDARTKGDLSSSAIYAEYITVDMAARLMDAVEQKDRLAMAAQ